MKTISSILAIAAIMASTDAMFADTDRDYLSMLRATYIDPNDDRSLSSTVNSDVDVRFFVGEERGQNDVSLQAEYPPQTPAVPPRHHPICGGVLGVYIRKSDVFFCRISVFKIEVVKEESNDPLSIRLILYFEENGMLPSVLLIPVLKLPAAVMIPQTETELEEWGRHYGVSTKPPLDFDMLLRLDATNSVTMDFGWLKDLLAFGVYWKSIPDTTRVRGRDTISIKTYITRPILLSEELMVRTKEFIDSFNDPDEESVGSNALSRNDASEDEGSSNR